MKKLLFILLLLTSLNAFSNTNTKKESETKTETISLQHYEIITGVVVDSKTNETLTGVFISLYKNKIYTDLNGEFKINQNDIESIKSVNFVSYQDYTITKINNKLIIKLNQL